MQLNPLTVAVIAVKDKTIIFLRHLLRTKVKDSCFK